MIKLKINPSQQISQTQKLSYYQRFELDILQMTSSELRSIIQEELESNPLLEQDMQYETGHIQKEPNNFELLLNYVIKEQTLSEYLHDQIRWYSGEIHADLAYFIADMLDSNGYLRYSNENLLKYFPMYNENDIEDTIHIIQSMEPSGIAARNLSECLLLQLHEDSNSLTDIAKQIIMYHLPDVAANRLSTISNNISVSIELVQKAVDLIKSLDPKPGSKFSNTSSYLYPDFFCYVEDENIYIELMNETYGLYTVSLEDQFNNDSLKHYKNWYQKAHHLISAIKKRAL